MTATEYGARSRRVRRAAHDLLRKYREERRARGAGAVDAAAADAVAPADDASGPTDAPRETLLASPRAEMLARSAAAEVEADARLDAEAAPEPAPEIGPEAFPESLDSGAADVSGEPHSSDGDAADGEEPRADEAWLSEPTPTAKPAGVASDLDALPGIGPGLVWVLEQAGIGTMAALAAADAEDLRRHLGVIGELVDIDSWIALAEERSGS